MAIQGSEQQLRALSCACVTRMPGQFKAVPTGIRENKRLECVTEVSVHLQVHDGGHGPPGEVDGQAGCLPRPAGLQAISPPKLFCSVIRGCVLPWLSPLLLLARPFSVSGLQSSWQCWGDQAIHCCQSSSTENRSVKTISSDQAPI